MSADQSALAALQRELTDLAYSCRQGFCRTCVVPVLDGSVEHRDRCLTDAEPDSGMAVCVSRAIGRLVLDA